MYIYDYDNRNFVNEAIKAGCRFRFPNGSNYYSLLDKDFKPHFNFALNNIWILHPEDEAKYRFNKKIEKLIE